MTSPLKLVTEESRPKYRIDFLKSHTVYKNAAGQRVPGVTTVLKMLDKPALLRWAWKMGKDGLELDAVRQGAADIGTVAHALCEAHLRDMELDSGNITPEVLGKAETGFIRFLQWWDKQGLRVVATELAMVSERMQVGGTGDVFAEGQDRLVYVELKTSKAIYDEMLIQAATYAQMYEECHGRHVDEVYIVRLGKEDTDDLEVVEVHKRPERVTAFAALAIARRMLQQAGMKV